MIYSALLATLAMFTLLDALITVVGMSVGCVELNPIVAFWGIQSWVIFRIVLLGSMLTVFFVEYQLCSKHFPNAVKLLKATLFILDLCIGAIVFSGFFAICSNLLF